MDVSSFYNLLLLSELNFQIFYLFKYKTINIDMGLIIEDIIDPDTKLRKDADLYNQYDFLTKFFLKFFCV